MALPAAANASAVITFTSSLPIPVPANDFSTQLGTLGLDRYTTTGAMISLNANAVLRFEFLGSESGFNDTFTAAGLPAFTEFTSFINNFGSPTNLGAAAFSAGSLAGLLTFTSSGPGAVSGVGSDGFGIFLSRGQVSGAAVSTFYLGYDDQLNNIDDNHDDMIIRVSVLPPVPEPATWMTMLLGFAAVGVGMRRRKRALVRQAA
ncbi:MAG: PEP-CTERM sorting domain-containing protein [Tardiphaga sp.]|nr:PEP-CTERM sorting domain-containing protein [Tardiphaga sp.]